MFFPVLTVILPAYNFFRSAVGILSCLTIQAFLLFCFLRGGMPNQALPSSTLHGPNSFSCPVTIPSFNFLPFTSWYSLKRYMQTCYARHYTGFNYFFLLHICSYLKILKMQFKYESGELYDLTDRHKLKIMK